MATRPATGSGSSPLARGTRHRGRRATNEYGLIPAGAGSTRHHPSRSTLDWAHPRWRGEHLQKTFSPSTGLGSSPLAWGAPLGWLRAGQRYGLIPAGAGSTRNCSRWCCFLRAHPRWRGEHAPDSDHSASLLGSSPLARGAHEQLRDCNDGLGLIPAGAGSTLSELWFFEPLSRFYFNLFLSPEGGESGNVADAHLLRALLHPRRLAEGVRLLGRVIRFTPSKSVGTQLCRWVLKSKPCSFAA